MPITLPKDAAAERFRWLHPFLEGRRTLTEMAEVSPFSYRTLKRWTAAYRQGGFTTLRPRSRRPHTCPWVTSAETASRIRTLRMTTSRYGAKKIAIRLRKEGTILHWRTVHDVLVREKLVTRRKRIITKDHWRPKATTPGELVEIDVAYAKKYKGRWLYQFTAVDACTRWRFCWVTPEQSNRTAIIFLRKLVAVAPFTIRGIKTDNGSIFTNYYTGYKKSADSMNPKRHIFDHICQELGITHYLIDPGKPAQNGKVERSHRTDREEFWRIVTFKTLPELRKKHAVYMTWHNEEREHLGLDGLTPTEKLTSLQGAKC